MTKMDLSNLTPAKGSVKNKKESLEVKALKKEALRHVDTKEQNLVLVILERLVLKVVKCHFREEFPNLDLPILIEKNIEE